MALDQKKIEFIQNNFKNSLKFRLTLYKILPMGWLSGMKVKELDEQKCVITVPYKRWNKNPFKSTFWAVLGMAAEMSSGAILTMYTYKQSPSIAMLVMSCEGNFVKKATGITTFTCNDSALIKSSIDKAITSGEAVIIPTTMEGKNDKGELVASFIFNWSIKVRKS
ncbi:MAG: hypothetical protein ACI9N1_002458 [Flavobacteriales bacterium]|jgi:hypothetical protein